MYQYWLELQLPGSEPVEFGAEGRWSMAADPKSVAEVNLVIDAIKREIATLSDNLKAQIGEFKAAVDRRFNGVNTRIYLIVGLIVGAVGGGFALRADIAEIRTDVANIKKDFADLKPQMSTLGQLVPGQQKIAEATSRIEDRLKAAPPDQL
jgi:hypothetical protein